MQGIINFINSFFSGLWNIVKQGTFILLDSISTIFYMLFDGFLFVVTNLISTLDLSALAFNTYAEWANLPPQSIYLINQLALPQCAAIIGAAMLIRMILNLIPAVITRV
ncbi:MAG: DUF2523 domain-containing protein [Proteobacteria bacterium]|nr:DUF2523 domain-containing protein [Pseudomonadota bacterium]